MDQINNNDSEIYKNAIKRTEHIYIKLEKSKMNCLVSDLKLVGTEKDILAHLKGGPSKNLINSFFNYTTDKCDFCKIAKDKLVQLDRAHCNKLNCDRSSLLNRVPGYPGYLGTLGTRGSLANYGIATVPGISK